MTDTFERGGKHRQQQEKITAAAIDLGTYGCRMLIGTLERRKRRIVSKFSQTVRLSVTPNGVLTPPSKNRLFKSLIHCNSILIKNHVSPFYSKCVGTAACRAIRDSANFVKEVKHHTGIDVDIISPREEIELACIGSMSLFAKQKHSQFKLIFDMGGGSTDFGIFIDQPNSAFPKCLACASLPYGILSWRNAYMHNPSTRDAVTHHTQDVVANLISECNISNPTHEMQMISTSGPLATIVTLNEGLKGYHGPRLHGFSISHQDTLHWIAKLEKINLEREDEKDTQGTITTVLPVLRGVMNAIQTKAYISNTGVRYGLLRKLLASPLDEQ